MKATSAHAVDWRLVYAYAHQRLIPAAFSGQFQMLAAVAVVAVLYLVATRGQQRSRHGRRFLTLAAVLVPLFSLALVFVMVRVRAVRREIRASEAAGRCRSVIGPVHIVEAEFPGGTGRYEFVTVSGVPFKTNEYEWLGGYQPMVRSESPLQEGVMAKLFYCPADGRTIILRVEVGRRTKGQEHGAPSAGRGRNARSPVQPAATQHRLPYFQQPSPASGQTTGGSGQGR